MSRSHRSRAATRVDLAGGTLDIWPICLLEPDATTVNVALARPVHARATLRTDGRFVLASADRGVREEHDDLDSVRAGSELALHRAVALHGSTTRGGAGRRGSGHGFELWTKSTVPAGSGLGGSSTMVIALLHALTRARGHKWESARVLRQAVDLEAGVIGVPTGAQDYLPALQGGLGVIRYLPGGPERTLLDLPLPTLSRRIVIAYTGLPHDSALNNWAITKAYLDGDPGVRRKMSAVAAAARDVAAALAAGDLDGAAEAVGAEWRARKHLAPGVTTRKIEGLGRAARAAGAISFKVCGAGGGGCVVYWCAAGRKRAVESALRDDGAELVPARFTAEPVT